jgi:hypothetical protein
VYVRDIDRFDAVPQRARQTKSLSPRTLKPRQHQREMNTNTEKKPPRGATFREYAIIIFTLVYHLSFTHILGVTIIKLIEG